MAISDKFQLSNVYQAIEANGADITAGTYSIQNIDGRLIGWKVATSLPAATDEPDFFSQDKNATDKITLATLEFWYARTERAASGSIGVLKAE